MRSVHLISVFLMACLPLGCANWPGTAGPESAAEQDQSTALQLIAEDFVIALQQIPTLQPSTTTVQLLQSELRDPFTRRMRDALQEGGYGTRWVENGAHSQLFQYRHEDGIDKASRPNELYEIAIGNIELRRRYVSDEADRTRPATPMYVRGADASRIVMNDSHFEPVSSTASLPAKGGASSAEAGRQTTSSASTAPQRLSVPSEVNPLNPLIAGTERKTEIGLPMIALPRVENVFELGGSNFTDILADSLLVREQVLTFANDSLRLGMVNKILVEQMVESYQPETDVFSVLGCSLGPTRLKSGNAALALGRASRVREALLFAGVPQDRILDEGCWADDGSGKALPRRGVVVTLHRKV